MNATSAAIPGYGELFINRAKGYGGERKVVFGRGTIARSFNIATRL